MCWASDEHPISRMADKDITCYKVFNKEDVIWSKIKSLDMTFKNDKILKIYSLFQRSIYIPYNTNITVNLICNFSFKHNFWFIVSGYHSYATLDKAKLHTDPIRCIIECLIPEGAEYYINKYQEIVSSDIIITDKVIN